MIVLVRFHDGRVTGYLGRCSSWSDYDLPVSLPVIIPGGKATATNATRILFRTYIAIMDTSLLKTNFQLEISCGGRYLIY